MKYYTIGIRLRHAFRMNFLYFFSLFCFHHTISDPDMGPDTTVGAVRFFYFLADCRSMHPQGCDVPLHGAAPRFLS